MKVGDTFDVSIGGVRVTDARVTWMEDGVAELIFEGQRVKMSYTTNLAPEATAPVDQPKVEPSKQVIIDGVDRAPSESAPVGDSAAVDVSGAATVTPVVEAGPATLATPPEAAQEAAVEPQAAEEKPAAPAEG